MLLLLLVLVLLLQAMELHARFVGSALLKDPALLPPEYAMLDFKQPPFNAAPSNTWAFDIKWEAALCSGFLYVGLRTCRLV